MIKSQGGVTLVEITMVLAIVAIVFSIGVTGYINWRHHVLLINGKEELKSTLLRAQQLATAAANNNNWGVHLEDKRYVLFSGSFYNEEDPLNIIKELSGIEILNASTTVSDGVGGLGSDVVFIKFTGQTYNTGTVQMIYDQNSEVNQSLQILSSGRID